VRYKNSGDRELGPRSWPLFSTDRETLTTTADVSPGAISESWEQSGRSTHSVWSAGARRPEKHRRDGLLLPNNRSV